MRVGANRAGIVVVLLALVGFGTAACGGGTTNGARSGMMPTVGVASQGPSVASVEPPASTMGGNPWWSSATTAPKKQSGSATVLDVTIENVKTPEGSEPAFVGPSGTVGATSLFSVKAHAEVEVVVDNRDSGPHTFTSPSLGLNVTIGPKAKVTFSFEAPGSGTYEWYCEVPCGSWVMSHQGYMKGKVTVVSS